MLIWFSGNPRMGWRSYEIVCWAASKTDHPSGKCGDIMCTTIIIISSLIKLRKPYILYSYPNFRRWDTERKEYLDASHQTLYLYLTLSFWRLTKKTKPNNSRTINQYNSFQLLMLWKSCFYEQLKENQIDVCFIDMHFLSSFQSQYFLRHV